MISREAEDIFCYTKVKVFQLWFVQTTPDRSNDVDLQKNKMDFDTAVSSVQGIAAKVQIDTLSPYMGFGGGIYKMTVVKRMKALPDFLEMPLAERRCEVERQQDCKTRRLLQQCACVPWEASDIQVKCKMIKALSHRFGWTVVQSFWRAKMMEGNIF